MSQGAGATEVTADRLYLLQSILAEKREEVSGGVVDSNRLPLPRECQQQISADKP